MTDDDSTTSDYMLKLEIQEDEALREPCKADRLPRRRMPLAVETIELRYILKDSRIDYKP